MHTLFAHNPFLSDISVQRVVCFQTCANVYIITQLYLSPRWLFQLVCSKSYHLTD